MTPTAFYLAFTVAERVAIKKSKDEGVRELWQTFEMLLAKDVPIDPNLPSVRDGLAYLVANLDGALKKDRVADILAGKAQ